MEPTPPTSSTSIPAASASQCPIPGTSPHLGPIQIGDIPRDARNQYSFMWSGLLGALQVAAGLASVGTMVGCFVAKAELSHVAHGIWCAIPFLLAGSCGLFLGVRRVYHNNVILGFLVMSCVSVAFSLILIAIAAYCIHLARLHFDYRDTLSAERQLLHSLHLVVGIVELCCCSASIFVCICYLRGRYHANTFQPYGVLHNAHYQVTAPPPGPSPHQPQTQVAGQTGVVFLTIPSSLYPPTGASPTDVFSPQSTELQEDRNHTGT